jgi:hypothetical protein
LAFVACQSKGAAPGSDAGGTGGAAGAGAGGSGGVATGVGGSAGAGNGGGSATDGGLDGALSSVAACTPGVGSGPGSSTEVDCNDPGTTFGVPNGAAVYGKTYVLPSPLIPGADNALSFDLTGSGPSFDFELWGANTPCKAEELLWWGPFGAGTQCAQFRPTQAFPYILFVYRHMYYASSYSFSTPRSMMCPGGTCPMGTTGTGKLSAAPITAPIGNYELTRYDRVALGWDMTLGGSGRMTVSWLGDAKKAGQPQPLSAGVFRLPATDPYGDAWYCIGDGSTFTEIDSTDALMGLTSVKVSLRGITRLGDCGATPGSGSLSATMYLSSTSATQFGADIAGTIASWTGTNLMMNQYCAGPFCNFRFRGPSQSHFLHLTTTADNLGVGTTAPVPVTEATWLVQASATQPFSMACSTAGTLDYKINDTSTLELANVTGPIACPGTPISNDQLDLTVDWQF